MLTDSEKLKEFRKSLRLSQPAFASSLDLATSTISMIECGKYKLSQTVINAIKKVYNYDIEKGVAILEKEFTVNTSNIIPIPFYHVKAAANPKGEVLVDYAETEALYFDKRWLKNILGINPYNASIIQAKGDSMDSGLNKSEDIKDGDLLLVDNSDLNIVNNRTYIFELNDGLLVKRAFQGLDGSITLISNNEKYEPRLLTEADNALVIGRVVWNGSRGNV